MELVTALLDLFVHLEDHLAAIIQQYGPWTYGLLFLIIFCETGLVVTPLLPGDSLLFAAGTFAASGALEVGWLFGLLSVAAVAGDTVNYWMGYAVGPRLIRSRNRWIKPAYLERTHRFYEKYGAETIIFARFVPIVRTFAPFLAGFGTMRYRTFLSYNVIGGLAWIAVFILGGYYFGNLPVVRQNFSLVIAAIVVISLVPAILEFARHRST